MAEIDMYATQTCDYCADARALFKKKGLTYKEIDVTGSKELRKEITKRANGGDTGLRQPYSDRRPDRSNWQQSDPNRQARLLAMSRA